MLTWDPGRRAVFAANDDYWGGRAYLDAVEIEMGRSPRDQALDFDLNKADIIELAPADVRRAQQSGKKVWTSATVDLVALVFDPGVDERTREAVALSIDRATIQNVLLQRQGAAAGGLLPQWLSGYAFLFPDARDLVRARQAASHASAPLTITYDPQDATVRSIGERIAVNAHEAGVDHSPRRRFTDRLGPLGAGAHCIARCGSGAPGDWRRSRKRRAGLIPHALRSGTLSARGRAHRALVSSAQDLRPERACPELDRDALGRMEAR